MSPQSIHQFSEKVALISDASSPVGRAAAMQLALQGSYVVGLFQGNAGSVDELVELGTLAHAVNADPSTDAGAADAAAAVDKLFGRLDLLVNCLKFAPESTFETTTESAFLDTVGRNTGSVQFLTRAVFSLMAGRPKPKIVNVISAVPANADPIFAATQAAVKSLTRSYAATFPANFRINCVEAAEAALAAGDSGKSIYQRPYAVANDDIARIVLFLLSSEAAGINGDTIRLG